MQEISKVVAIGPESTGKSTLCTSLATHFNGICCPEFAREYLLRHGTNYSFDNLLTIAQGQLALEEQYTLKAIDHWNVTGKKTQRPLLFVDTDMYVMKVWCEYVFNRCHDFILDKIVQSNSQLYLLCNIDLPWVRDELREYPDLKSREELFHIYKDILINQPVSWAQISGSYDARLQLAIGSVEQLLLREIS